MVLKVAEINCISMDAFLALKPRVLNFVAKLSDKEIVESI
jgi:hypothetical protein